MTVNIIVPDVGESIVDARVARWLKKVGDTVAAGEPLVELETDKVDVEVAAPKSGVLQSIAHADGADVKIGDTLGAIETAATGTTRTAATTGEVSSPAESQADAEVGAGASVPAQSAAGSTAPVTPSARRLARQQQVSLTSSALEPEPRKPEPRHAGTVERGETRERMSKRRATIARRLVEAQRAAALLTTFNEVDMSAVTAVRERRKEAFKAKHGVGIGIASFFIKATVAALTEFPRLNAEIQGDEIVRKQYYDIGVAVGAEEGLVVPVIRDADRLSFAEIELRIRDFAARAQNGTLTLDDLRGGTFSITNGGVYGSLMSTPIVNPPQVGILGLHAIKQRPIGVGGQVVLRPMMYVALTYDHRIVDGSEAVRFLVRVKDLVEEPALLLVES